MQIREEKQTCVKKNMVVSPDKGADKIKAGPKATLVDKEE